MIRGCGCVEYGASVTGGEVWWAVEAVLACALHAVLLSWWDLEKAAVHA